MGTAPAQSLPSHALLQGIAFLVFIVLQARLARYLFSPEERVPLDGPAAGPDAALADGSLEQALVLRGQRLGDKMETRGFWVQTPEETTACQTRQMALQVVHLSRGNCQVLRCSTVSGFKVER